MDKEEVGYIAEDLDNLAPDSVFCVYDEDDPCPYNVGKYAGMVKKLGLEKDEDMPDEYLEQCLACTRFGVVTS